MVESKVTNAFDDLEDARHILREIKMLSFFDHDNIVTLLDVPKPDNKETYNDVYVITDLMETDLHRVIYSRQELTDEHIQYFIYQILRGTLYFHSAKVIHRDLKPDNLFLTEEDTISLKRKLGTAIFIPFIDFPIFLVKSSTSLLLLVKSLSSLPEITFNRHAFS